ncbi:MAG: DUF6588 family protein [Chryseotalea sp.]|jgi:hypothetical protein|nr:hypothetical protein [Flammeovirgaceae bacterium]
MKKHFQTIAIALGLILTSNFFAFSQGNLDDLLKGSKDDANYLARGYLEPFLKVTATGLNQGWFNTAKPHKIAGFDITASIAFVSIPSTAKFFTVDNNSLNSIALEQDVNGNPVAANGTGQIPTIFGPGGSDNAARFGFANPVLGADFDAPDGAEFEDIISNRIPIPVANIGIGLPKGTELKVRWTPKIDVGDGELSMIGFGLMHDVKQYLPGIKMLPFDLSALVTYSRFNINARLEDGGPNGEGNFTVTGTTVQALISKKISVLTPYAAIGYAFGKASADVKGTYQIDNITSIEDPVSISATQNGPRITAGLRLKLLILTIHADYTLQKYSTLTAGVGLSIR